MSKPDMPFRYDCMALIPLKFWFAMEQNDSSATEDTHYFYLDRLLSEHMGKNIRHGNIFKIKGYQVQCEPKDTGAQDDFDVGGALSGVIRYAPVTTHTVKAWKAGFMAWKKQQSLSAKFGSLGNKWNDFEVALNASHSTDSRISDLYDNPLTIADGDAQAVGLYGVSNDSTNYTSLFDLYNSRNPVPSTPTNHYGNTLKGPKFSSYLNNQTSDYELPYTTTNSAGTVADSSALFSADAEQTTVWLPRALPVLTGSLCVTAKFTPKDTAVQIEDDLYCNVTIWIQSFNSILKSSGRRYVRKSRSSRKKSYTRKFRSRSYGRKKTRSRRRY